MELIDEGKYQIELTRSEAQLLRQACSDANRYHHSVLDTRPSDETRGIHAFAIENNRTLRLQLVQMFDLDDVG